MFVGWRRGWDSHHCWLLKTKNLSHVRFRQIRQIRSKAKVETRIEHAENRVSTGMRPESTGSAGVRRPASVKLAALHRIYTSRWDRFSTSHPERIFTN